MAAEKRLTESAHDFLAARIADGGVTLDATAGNGHDSVFLARRVGDSGLVYGFDIQADALDKTYKRLQDAGLEARVRLIHAGHQDMVAHIDARHRGRLAAVMFNLGYLPGGDKHLVTRTRTTLAALAGSAEILAPGGGLSILAYPGHAGGAAECASVAQWVEAACRPVGGSFRLFERRAASPAPHAPVLFLLSKIV